MKNTEDTDLAGMVVKSEIALLRRIARQAMQLFMADDLWIDGIQASQRAEELKKSLAEWRRQV